MAKQYIKTASGLAEVDTQQIKNYASKECVEAAIASGELKEGELFSTNVHVGIDEDIVDKVHNIELLIPESASAQNVLVTVCQLMCCIQDMDIGNLRTQVDTNTSNIATNTNNIALMDLTVQNHETALSCRVTCTDYNTCTTAIDNALSGKVSCTDYTTKMATVDTAITTNANGIQTLTSNMSNFLTNVFTPLECYACNCLVQCCDFTSYKNSVCTALQNLDDYDLQLENRITANEQCKVDCSWVTDVYTPQATGWTCNIDDLGTRLNTLNRTVTNLSNCSGLDCIGNVTDVQMNDALACKVECTDYTTCIACLVARLTALESCPGLNCTGTLDASNFSYNDGVLEMTI